MRVLVTGGAGFIGSHVVEQLCALDHEVLVLDRAARPGHLPPAARYVRADVTSADAWRVALPGVDAVCHQAAKVGLGLRASDVSAYVDDNDVGTAAGLVVTAPIAVVDQNTRENYTHHIETLATPR